MTTEIQDKQVEALGLGARGPDERGLGRRPRRAGVGARGLTVLEVVITTAILIVAVVALMNTIVRADHLAETNRETAIATEAAQQAAAELESWPLGQVYALFNASSADDPSGPGTGMGADFFVDGLPPRPEDPDGLVGKFLFPEAGGSLREDVVDPSLGMPRDLNGDGSVDGAVMDYVILPVTVRIEWRGVSGNRAVDLDLVLMP